MSRPSFHVFQHEVTLPTPSKFFPPPPSPFQPTFAPTRLTPRLSSFSDVPLHLPLRTKLTSPRRFSPRALWFKLTLGFSGRHFPFLFGTFSLKAFQLMSPPPPPLDVTLWISPSNLPFPPRSFLTEAALFPSASIPLLRPPNHSRSLEHFHLYFKFGPAFLLCRGRAPQVLWIALASLPPPHFQTFPVPMTPKVLSFNLPLEQTFQGDLPLALLSPSSGRGFSLKVP